MKRIFVSLAIIAITIVAFAQNNYYWSAGIKHYLKEEPGVFIVKFTGKEITEDIIKNLQSKQDIEYVTSIKDDLGIIIAKEGIDLTIDRLKAYDELKNAIPAYEFGNIPFYLTGEILLQPQSGISIVKILEFVDNEATVKRKTKYNTFVLETGYCNKLLEYSNRIYESGLLKFSHPNFISYAELFQVIPNDTYFIYQITCHNTKDQINYLICNSGLKL